MKSREQSNIISISCCFFLLTCFSIIPRKTYHLSQLLDQNVLHAIHPYSCLNSALLEPSALPAECWTSHDQNRQAQILLDTQIPEPHTTSVFLARDRNLYVSRQRPASSQGLPQDQLLHLELTGHSKFSATTVFCSASHARNPARAFPPGPQGQYLRRMSYPI